jgi:hypothetical protein
MTLLSMVYEIVLLTTIPKRRLIEAASVFSLTLLSSKYFKYKKTFWRAMCFFFLIFCKKKSKKTNTSLSAAPAHGEKML